MLRQYLAMFGTAAAVVASLGTVLSGASYAQYSYEEKYEPAVKFYCQEDSYIPTTVAVDSQTGYKREVVKWYSDYFEGSGYDNITRCREVSARFQRAYNTGSLDYITAGIVNGYQVVCATSAGGSCTTSNVLFTLKRDANAAETLQALFDVRDLGSGPLYESSGRTYINMNQLLETDSQAESSNR